MPCWRSRISDRWTKSWQTPAPPSSRSSTVEPTNVAPGRYSKRSGITSQSRSQRLARRVRRASPRAGTSSAPLAGSSSGRQEELAARRPRRRARAGAPRRRAGGPRRRLGDHLALGGDREPVVLARHVELDHLGAEVVGVGARARVRIDHQRKPRTRWSGGARGLDAQHVVLVVDRSRVAVLGVIAQGEPHRAHGRGPARCSGGSSGRGSPRRGAPAPAGPVAARGSRPPSPAPRVRGSRGRRACAAPAAPAANRAGRPPRARAPSRATGPTPPPSRGTRARRA